MRAGERDRMFGVLEGFYGQPWSQSERFQLFGWMADWALNAYLYAPKDDLKHRAVWRKCYDDREAAHLSELVRACKARGIHFIYGIGPGLDIVYSKPEEIEHLKHRFEQLISFGCQRFAILFDDIPERMNAEDKQAFGSFAAAQAHVANQLYAWLGGRQRESRLLFCPFAYCGRMVERKLGGDGYLEILGRQLHHDIDVFWTGPEIISREITAAHLREVRQILRRKPVIWDNLHANDYDVRRFFCGPYAGRPPEILQEIAGILSNPNSEFPLNYIPLRTLAAFVKCHGSWDSRSAYLSAMQEWQARFATNGQPFSFEDLILFGDCYYLPFEEGPGANALYEDARKALSGREDRRNAFLQRATRLRELCQRLPELRDRPLFYALSRRVWELREELDLLERCVRSGSPPFQSDAHLPGTYRGGFVPRLQSLLVQRPDGTLVPSQSA